MHIRKKYEQDRFVCLHQHVTRKLASNKQHCCDYCVCCINIAPRILEHTVIRNNNLGFISALLARKRFKPELIRYSLIFAVVKDGWEINNRASNIISRSCRCKAEETEICAMVRR